MVGVPIAKHVAFTLRPHDTPISCDVLDITAVAFFRVLETASRESVIGTLLETGLDGIVDSVDNLVGENTRGPRFTE